uniref:3-ketoacyl-CoA reductase n=1 Tax=Nothobranchius furzeri TaxID=105023 RepID=A0A8C6LUR1_NOTFU
VTWKPAAQVPGCDLRVKHLTQQKEVLLDSFLFKVSRPRLVQVSHHVENGPAGFPGLFIVLLLEQFKVETRTIAVDFGKTDIYRKIEAGLTGLEIGVLVNNVGVSYPYPEYYLHIPDLEHFITNTINVNMTSVCQMTRLVLPRMVDRSKGVILNISSASGMYPVPLLTVYSATKAFVDFFSRGLQEEYRRQGIIIQSVLPFFVVTKMTRIRKPTLDKPTPERYVAAELNTVGLQSQTNGYFPHAIMGWVTTRLVPSSIVIFLGARMNRLQRTGYLQRRKLREQKNGASLKNE